MDRIHIVISAAVSALVLNLPAVAADPPNGAPPKAPLEQASESVNKNLRSIPTTAGCRTPPGALPKTRRASPNARCAARSGPALDGQQAIARGTPSALEMRVFLSGRADARTEVTGYALRGLRDGSPDRGAGVLVNWRL